MILLSPDPSPQVERGELLREWRGESLAPSGKKIENSGSVFFPPPRKRGGVVSLAKPGRGKK